MTKEKQVSGMEKDAKKKDEYRKIVDMAKYTQDMKSEDEISRMKSQISKNKMSKLQHKAKSFLPKNVKIAKEKADQFMKATKKGQKLGLKRQSKNKDLNKAEKRMRQAAASKPNLDFGEFHSALGEFRLVPSTDPHNPKIKGYRVRMKGTPEQNKLPDNDPKLGQMGLMSGLFVRKFGKDKPVTKEQAENMASNELNYDTTVINASYDELPMGVDFDTKKFDAKSFAKAMKKPNRVFDLSRDEVPLENTRFKNMGRHVVIPESTDLTNSVLNNVDVSELRHSDIKNSYVQNTKLIGVNNIDHSNLSLGVNAIVNGSTIKNSKLLNRTFKGNPDLINNSTIENSIFSMRDGGIAVGDSSLNHVTSIGPAEIEQSIIKAPKGNIVLNHPTISDRAIETKSSDTIYVHNDSKARKVPVLSDNVKPQLNTAKNGHEPYLQRRTQEILQAKHDPDVQRAVPKMIKRLKQEAKNMHIQPNLNGKDFDGDPKRELKRGDKVMNLKGEKGKAFKKGDKIMDTKGRKMEVGKDFDGDPKPMRDPMLEQMLKAQRRTQEILQAKYDPDVQRALHGRDFDGDVKPMRDPMLERMLKKFDEYQKLHKPMRDPKAVEHFKQEAEHMKTGIQPDVNGRDFNGDVTQDILQEKHNPDMQSRMKHIQNLLQAKHDPNAARVKQMLDPSDYEHYHYGKPSAMPDLTRDVDVVNHAEVFAKTAEEYAVGVEMPFKSMDTPFNDAPNKQEHGDLGEQKEDDGPDIDFD